jgi:hypothetical protein
VVGIPVGAQRFIWPQLDRNHAASIHAEPELPALPVTYLPRLFHPPRANPGIVAMMLASKSRGFRHRVETVQLSRSISGFDTFEETFRSSRFDELMLPSRSESFKLCKPDLYTFHRFRGG